MVRKHQASKNLMKIVRQVFFIGGNLILKNPERI